jgi:DeoR/GlpR family transcriptional regulator of sugar metabolism
MFESRKRTIFEMLSEHGTATVIDIAERLGVSPMTVRRDIQAMASEGLVRRVHGGAAALHASVEVGTFGSRQVEELGRKKAIAASARGLLQGGETVYIDGSTTCGELARLLPGAAGFTVVTDSLYVVREVAGKQGIDLLVLGGLLDRDGNTFDGALTVENAEKIGVDVCFFSVRGLSADFIGNEGLVGTQVKQRMIRHAGRSVLLADSTKLGRKGLIRVCTWDEVDILVTDEGADPAGLDQVRLTGIDVRVVSTGAGS